MRNLNQTDPESMLIKFDDDSSMTIDYLLFNKFIQLIETSTREY